MRTISLCGSLRLLLVVVVTSLSSDVLVCDSVCERLLSASPVFLTPSVICGGTGVGRWQRILENSVTCSKYAQLSDVAAAARGRSLEETDDPHTVCTGVFVKYDEECHL